MPRIIGRTYHDEVIVLDDHEFEDCTFTNVQFEYAGTQVFHIDASCTVQGHCSVKLHGTARTVSERVLSLLTLTSVGRPMSRPPRPSEPLDFPLID